MFSSISSWLSGAPEGEQADDDAGKDGESAIQAQGGVAETLEAEHQSLILSIAKNLSWGMDLSRIPLPTYVLESRSLLEKLSDAWVYPDVFSDISKSDDQVERVVRAARWFISGWNVREPGVKKPFNPIIGEVFRCKWRGSKDPEDVTFFCSEQVEHHPPVSALYVANEKAGLLVNAVLHSSSRFLGNTVEGKMDGFLRIWNTKHDERFTINFPNAYARGILFGTLIMELAGKVVVSLDETPLRCELDFLAKGWISGTYNEVVGKVLAGDKELWHLKGKWDTKMTIQRPDGSEARVLWDCEKQLSNRAPRVLPPRSLQVDHESRRLWRRTSRAIRNQEHQEAADEKFKLEQEQRKGTKHRKANNKEWQQIHFPRDDEYGDYLFKQHRVLLEALSTHKDGLPNGQHIYERDNELFIGHAPSLEVDEDDGSWWEEQEIDKATEYRWVNDTGIREFSTAAE